MLIDTPTIRVVDRRELPSTRLEMIRARFSVLSLFILILYVSGHAQSMRVTGPPTIKW